MVAKVETGFGVGAAVGSVDINPPMLYQSTKILSTCQAFSEIFNDGEEIFWVMRGIKEPFDVPEPSIALAAQQTPHGARKHNLPDARDC